MGAGVTRRTLACGALAACSIFGVSAQPARAECLSWVFWQMSSAAYLGGGFGHFYAYAPEKWKYPIDRYTMEVMADDKLVEKKDKGANEPVQFYVLSKARQPYEIVVNDVSKDTVKGYLSTPKTTVSRSAGQ